MPVPGPCSRRPPRAPVGVPGLSARRPATALALPVTRILAPTARWWPKSKRAPRSGSAVWWPRSTSARSSIPTALSIKSRVAPFRQRAGPSWRRYASMPSASPATAGRTTQSCASRRCPPSRSRSWPAPPNGRLAPARRRTARRRRRSAMPSLMPLACACVTCRSRASASSPRWAENPMHLHLLSGGAAQGLVEALSQRLGEETGATIAGSFGAVGAMREKLLAGAPADLLILTAPLIEDLAREGHVDATTILDVGLVRTAVAVPSGAATPPIDTADRLRAALLAADAIYFPDPQRATAGIHFAKVLAALGITGALMAGRAQIHANGAAAMQALAGAGPGAIGATQATEILSTPGVRLIGALPAPFELATIYTLALSTRAQAPAPARVLARLLTDPEQADLRARLGFEPLPAHCAP